MHHNEAYSPLLEVLRLSAAGIADERRLDSTPMSRPGSANEYTSSVMSFPAASLNSWYSFFDLTDGTEYDEPHYFSHSEIRVGSIHV